MTLRPVLPVLPDESLTSYLRRVASFHAGTDIYKFLDVIDLSRSAVVDPSPVTLGRISALTGHPLDVLHRTVLRSIQPRIRAFGAEQFHTEFANLKQTSFCPACLLEDALPHSPSGGLRVGRVSWRLEPVRTCRHHGIALVRTPITAKPERFQHMDEVAPDDAELVRLAAAAERRAPSGLQTYVEARLDCGQGPAWMDGQPIDLAARACEMLGLLLTQEVKRKMPAVSSSELDTAGDVGFGHAAAGEEGIRAALRIAHDRARAGGGVGGPQHVFGFFHAWLGDSGKQKPFGPIREVTREYILDHFAVEEGTTLFGEAVTRSRKHTVHSLARKLSAHPKRVQRALVHAGMIDGDPERASHHTVFDAQTAEALFVRIDTALSNRELRGYLNCHRTQAEQLVGAGILPQIIGQGDRGKNAAQHVAREDADAFLATLIGRAHRVSHPSAGMVDIVRAARASGWSVVDIVTALLAGRLARVECVDPELRFAGVLVDPAEVRTVLSHEVSEDFVCLDEAARMLRTNRYRVNSFLKLRDAAGTAYLTAHFVENAEGARTRVFSRSELTGFLEAHVTLSDIAAEAGRKPRWIKPELDARGVSPIATKSGVGCYFYRRSDLAGISL